MEVARFEALEVDQSLARKVAVLLGRAFTDERHVRDYTAEQEAELGAAVHRVHRVLPAPGELMPPSYLEKFPTLRNFERPADARRACAHFIAMADGYAAAHVALFAQHFRFEGLDISGGYVEDVATDPLHLGRGLASSAMRLAEAHGRALGLDVLGLATGIMPFYARLGWRAWPGGHTFNVADFGLSYPDEPLMLLPLSPRGEQFAAGSGQMVSWRLWKFGDQASLS